MRMRKRAHLAERIEGCGDYAINTAEELLSFLNGRPLHIEIGCGKGRFIINTALKNPAVCHLAVEQCENVAILAAEHAKRAEVKNLRFAMKNIALLDEVLPEGAVSRIYLNFSDPWPKKKRAKRRLTHPDFLRLYKKWLSPDGEIFFKTDNAALFEFSLNSFAGEDFLLSAITFDLHKSDFEGNIMTEYEERFAAEGKPIYRLEARKRA